MHTIQQLVPSTCAANRAANDATSGTEALSLENFTVQNGATAYLSSSGSLEVVTCVQRWGYSVIFPVQPHSVQRWGDDRSVLLTVAVATQRGVVGIACLDTRSGEFVTQERFASAQDGVVELELFCRQVDAAVVLVLRNAAPDDQSSLATVHGIRSAAGRTLSVGRRRQLTARGA